MPHLLSVGTFRLNTGVDLLLVALLQVLSYPFHDPVLTDRGFITEEKTMLRAMVWSGVLGFVCIFAFSLVGVHAKLEGLPAATTCRAKWRALSASLPFFADDAGDDIGRRVDARFHVRVRREDR